jgi:hypothetical protein
MKQGLIILLEIANERIAPTRMLEKKQIKNIAVALMEAHPKLTIEEYEVAIMSGVNNLTPTTFSLSYVVANTMVRDFIANPTLRAKARKMQKPNPKEYWDFPAFKNACEDAGCMEIATYEYWYTGGKPEEYVEPQYEDDDDWLK